MRYYIIICMKWMRGCDRAGRDARIDQPSPHPLPHKWARGVFEKEKAAAAAAAKDVLPRLPQHAAFLLPFFPSDYIENCCRAHFLFDMLIQTNRNLSDSFELQIIYIRYGGQHEYYYQTANPGACRRLLRFL
jgi:hypothetical protein